MTKKIALICLWPVASLLAAPGAANAQLAPFPVPQAQTDPAPAIPDDVRLVILIRNAVLALNQANQTGNYSVLREMGTPAFQMTNSPARLAEAFSTMRQRKLDLSPVMLFNPKLTTPAAFQDGQVLRLTGFFPTSPEQVQFDLAYQRSGDRWLLAGLAVNVAPPGEGMTQASTSPASQLAQNAAEVAKPGEAKPIRIDLSQPATAPGKGVPAKKPAAQKKPPKTPAQKTAQAPAAPAPAAEAPAPPPPPPAEPAPEKPASEKPAQNGNGFANWNPFGR